MLLYSAVLCCVVLYYCIVVFGIIVFYFMFCLSIIIPPASPLWIAAVTIHLFIYCSVFWCCFGWFNPYKSLHTTNNGYIDSLPLVVVVNNNSYQMENTIRI